MKILLKTLFLCGLMMPGLSARAAEYRLSGLTISALSAAPTRPGQPNAAAYLTVQNQGASEDRLIGVSIDARIAQRGELHTMSHENGMMIMREVTGFQIPARGVLQLKPGGDHLMLIGLKEQLSEQQRISARLQFEKAGVIDVVFTVEAQKAEPKRGHQHHR